MPNHITNVLRITGYKHRGAPAGLVDEILASLQSEGSPFDFNRIIPMPVELQITSGGVTDSALALHDDARASQMLGYPWAIAAGLTTIEQLRAHMRESYLKHPSDGLPTLDDFAARVRANLDRYGHADWYSWCNHNWDTKWNAYSTTVGKVDDTLAIAHFETAWAPPMKVLDKLAEKFPKANFRLIWCDEGSDSYHRVYWEDGKRDTE